jgi:hypothetical protein
MSAPLSSRGYTPGHPWHYHLGGAVPSPREIRAAVRLSRYLGYREPEIRSAAALAEPARSRALDAIRRDVCNGLRADISRYREVARALYAERRGATGRTLAASCSDICTSMSLKYAHIANGFAHLDVLDRLPRQADLFDGP